MRSRCFTLTNALEPTLEMIQDTRNADMLTLRLIRGIDLISADANGYSDPYCKIITPLQMFKSSVVKRVSIQNTTTGEEYFLVAPVVHHLPFLFSRKYSYTEIFHFEQL